MDNNNKTHILEKPDSTPERSFSTPWLLCNSGFFRVYLTIVGPQSKQPKYYLPLTPGETKGVLKAITNEVKLPNIERRGNSSAR